MPAIPVRVCSEASVSLEDTAGVQFLVLNVARVSDKDGWDAVLLVLQTQ